MQRLRPFLGSRDFDQSRAFYRQLGFGELELSDTMSVFNLDEIWFYLQRCYVKEWIENTMVFWEVDDLDAHHASTKRLNLPDQFDGVKLSRIHDNDWGREYFLHDPAGNLWHIGHFKDESD